MARFSLDFCLTFLLGCSHVPAADAVRLFVFKCPSTITEWFLTYPLVRCCGQLVCRSGQFQLQKGLISETMQQTAEATVSRLRWPGFPDCWYRVAVSSARSATRILGSGQKE